MKYNNLTSDKEKALNDLRKAKSNYLQSMTNENWILYCNCKKKCMQLGIII